MIENIDFESFKATLAKSMNLAGPLLTISDPSVVETLLFTNPDMIIVDMEHSAIDVTQLQAVCIASGTIPVLARIRGLEKNEIKKVLDTGVHGVIVPGIETAREASSAVRFSRFAPEGKRGAGPGRASGYGNRIMDYIKGRPLVFVQIETLPAFEQVEEIAGVDGLDGLFIGPFDLSIALQMEFSWDNPEFNSAVRRIVKAAHENNILTGIYSPMKEETLIRTAKEGFNFIMLGMDREAIVSGYSSAIKRLKTTPS